jgi:hypothetical protein
MKQVNKRLVIGWIAVGISTIISCFWAFWGIIENFHEGWYFELWLSNLGLMVVQYLSPMILFVVVTLISIFWPRFGSLLHVSLALLATWFFQAISNPGIFLLIAPLVGLGTLYWFGRPEPRKVATLLVISLPLLTLVIAGIGTDLIWAPDGPGWPRSGATWHEAQEVCQHLNEDGLTLVIDPQDIWRLPGVDEAVGSMARHGQNSGGEWHAQTKLANYKTKPDKEAPLWNTHSQVIYWWTATEIDEDRAFIIVYDGKVWPRSKQISPAYLGFRCVKQP